ncbi:MAG TPA: parallel beta-helix domain-containing protein [Blastocatellia bacterium]|nr:parallel beta-helix domain-containing protein [Blastocatellia bacterium]
MMISSPSTKSPWAGRLRYLLIVAVAIMFLVMSTILVIGMIPIKPDVPPGGVTIGNPGGGGLRRPFPPLNQRTNNPSSQEKIELGRLLYFDPILSGENTQSCATCHHPDLGFSDARNFSMGAGGTGLGPDRTGGKQIRRGAPTVWNAVYSHKLFWDGRANDLEDQARSPITAPDEMNQRPEDLVKELKAIPEYVRKFDQSFGGQAGSALTFDNVTNAIAAFERTLISNNSPFDRYVAGDPNALTPEQRRGLTLFRSLKTRCFECHGFPTFANPDFKVIGVPPVPGQADDLGRAEIEGGEPYRHAFKVPTLRNVALTAPYMHNGRFKTLEEVVIFYSVGGGLGSGVDLPNIDDKIRRFMLSTTEKRELIAFLNALTDESKKPAIPERVPSGLPVVAHLKPAPTAAAPPTKAAAPDRNANRQPKTWLINPGESIQAALDRAIPGDTIEIRPGTYHETLLVDVDNLTIRGIQEGGGQKPVLDGERQLSDAVITSSHNFTIEGLVIKDFAVNGITVHGALNATFRNLEIHDAGLYGIYPVECKGVLVENCLVTGIKDAGIYVGQSRDIIVRNNEAHHNVTGIEIENSVNAVVENNYTHDNTGGILVFLLPNNPSKVGSDTRVIGNRILNNNLPNFGDKNSTVGKVEPGSGLLIIAADRTEVTRNEIQGNDSFGIAVVSLALAFPNARSFDVGSLPEGNKIHDNRMADNGRNPGPQTRSVGGTNLDLIWDGSGWSNSWNQPGAKSFPQVLPNEEWPEFAQRAYTRIVSFLRDRLM